MGNTLSVTVTDQSTGASGTAQIVMDTPQQPPPQPRLLQQSDLHYLGGFRLPANSLGKTSYGYSYGGAALGYNPARNSLFVLGHPYEQAVGEVSIPPPSSLVQSNDVTKLPVAVAIQDPVPILAKAFARPINMTGSSGGLRIGGLLVVGSQLVGDAYSYYDAALSADASHFVLNGCQNLATALAPGFYKLGSLNPGYVAGGMCPLPTDAQALLGAPYLTGQGALNIITRTSFGPAAFGFDPATFNLAAPAPAFCFLRYDQGVGPTYPEKPNAIYCGATSFGGMAFPGGSRSLLFFQNNADVSDPSVVSCYGALGDVLGQNAAPGYDLNGYLVSGIPINDGRNQKGAHAISNPSGHGSYGQFVLAYDALDLLAVKQGSKTPQGLMPYNLTNGVPWKLALPVPGHDLGGVTQDTANNIIYVAQLGADTAPSPYYNGPVIHAFAVAGAFAGA